MLPVPDLSIPDRTEEETGLSEESTIFGESFDVFEMFLLLLVLVRLEFICNCVFTILIGFPIHAPIAPLAQATDALIKGCFSTS